MKPIFILSLPRSGSTLLQRVLASHSKIATASEPWFLLPLVYATRRSGIVAEYDQAFSVKGVEDFLAKMPHNRQDYWHEVQRLALALYSHIGSSEETHFLDKTPRYHLIIDELKEIFPDARFIILLRNPLAAASSMMNSWSNGNWNLHRCEIDLYAGVSNLAKAIRLADERFYTIKYENFVANPLDEYTRLLEFLSLEPETSGIHKFVDVSLEGRMGDFTGVAKYNSIDSSASEKWPATFSNPWRRFWACKYLDELGDEKLSLLGYSAASLREQLQAPPISLRHFSSDLLRVVYRQVLPVPEQKFRKRP